jgi:hypothetical protein
MLNCCKDKGMPDRAIHETTGHETTGHETAGHDVTRDPAMGDRAMGDRAIGLAHPAPARLAWWSAVCGLCVVLLLPLLLVDVPPLLDYPNHLARAWLLAGNAADPVLAQIYLPHWSIIPNLATDLIWPPLMRILPVHVAGRLVVALMVLLPVAGCLAYSRAVFGARAWWPLASALVAYQASLLFGFLNFVISTGVALLLAAAWIAWRDRYPARTVALVGLGIVALFFCHLMGLIFCFVLIGSHELDRAARARFRPSVLLRRAALLLSVMVAPTLLYALSNLQAVSPDTRFLPPAQKALQLLTPFLNYDFALDVATASLVMGFLVVLLALRRARVTLGSATALVTLLALYLVSPFEFKGTASLDTRFAVMLGFMLFAGILPDRLPRRAAALAGGCIAALFTVRMAVLASAWHGHAADLAGLRRVMAGLMPGDRVYITSVTPTEAPSYWNAAPASRRLSSGIRLDYHIAALVLIEHKAFWPYLFADPSQQPIALTPLYQALAEQEADLPAHEKLAACVPGDGPLSPGNIGFRGYDYVLMLEAGGEPDAAHFAEKRLKLVASSDMAALYRIREPIPPCAVTISGIAPAIP